MGLVVGNLVSLIERLQVDLVLRQITSQPHEYCNLLIPISIMYLKKINTLYNLPIYTMRLHVNELFTYSDFQTAENTINPLFLGFRFIQGILTDPEFVGGQFGEQEH